MKFIKGQFLDFKNDARHRYIYLNPENGDTPEAPEEDEGGRNLRSIQNRRELEDSEKVEELLEVLENPIEFSVRDIKFIENNQNLLRQIPNYRKKIEDIVLYFYSLASSDVAKNVPSRVLYGIAKSNIIKRYVPAKLNKSIKTVIDRDLDSLRDFKDRSVNDWTSYEIVKYAGLYSHFQDQVLLGGNLDVDFIDLINKFVEKAISLLASSGDDLSAKDRLVLLEIQKTIPADKWMKVVYSDKVSVQAGSVNSVEKEGRKILDSILAGDKQSPELLYFWEQLEDLATSPQHFYDLSQEELEKIRNLVVRGNAAKFMMFSEKEAVLNKIHLKALDGIKDNLEFLRGGSGHEKNSIVEWSKKDAEKRDKLMDKINDLTEIISDLSDKEVNAVLRDNKGSVAKVLSDNYNEVGQQLDAGHIVETPLFDRAKGVVEAFIASDADTDENARSEFEAIFGNLDVVNRKIVEFEANQRLSEGEVPALSEELERSKANYVDEFWQRVKKVQGSSDAKLRPLKNYLAETVVEGEDSSVVRVSHEDVYEAGENQRKFGKLAGKLQRIGQDIMSEVKKPFSKELEDKKAALAELKKEYESLQSSEVQVENFVNYFDGVEDNLKARYKSYYEGLQSRINNHSLHAADMEVLFMDPSDENDPENRRNLPAEISEAIDQTRYLDFRDRFKAVLDVKLDDLAGGFDEVVGGEFDNLAIWLNRVDTTLSVSGLYEELKADISATFEAPVIESEVIGALMNHFRTDINDVVRAVLDEKTGLTVEEKEDYINNLRIHSSLNTREKESTVSNAFDSHIENVKGIDVKIESEKQVIEGASASLFPGNSMSSFLVENLIDKSPGSLEVVGRALSSLDLSGDLDGGVEVLRDYLGESLSSEVEDKKLRELVHQIKFNQIFDYNSNVYRNGVGSFPGVETIDMAKLKLAPYVAEMENELNPLLDDCSLLASHLKVNNESEARLLKKRIQLQWTQETRENILQLVNEVRAVSGDIFRNNPEFFSEFFGLIDQSVVIMDDCVSGLDNDQLSFDDELFGKMSKASEFIRYILNFEEGYGADNRELAKTNLEAGKDGIAELGGLGFFEDEYDENGELLVTGEEKARKNFDEIKDDYNAKFKVFKDRTKFFKDYVQKDLNGMDDIEFVAKYATPKSEIDETLNTFLSAEHDFESVWNNFSGPSAFDLWLSKYYGGQEAQAEAMNDLVDWRSMTARIENVTAASEDLRLWMDETDAYKKKAGLFGRGGHLGSGYSFYVRSFSLYDIYMVVKTAIDAYETRWKRKSDQSVADLGMSVFGENSFMGKEFARMADDSEDQRVKEYKTTYAEAKGHELLQAIYDSKDEDEVRACIDMSIEKGFLQWDDPDLWRTLMRLQSPRTIIFNIPEDRDNMSYNDIVDKVKRISGGIWTEEVFKLWDQSMDSSLDKAKNEHSQKFDNVDRDDGGQMGVLIDILRAWEAGDTENADPSMYEYFLQRAFTDGKINGQPDKRWFFLVKGLSVKNPSGRSLLSKNVLTTLYNKVLANVPHFEFFIDASAWKKDGRIVPEGTPGAHSGHWTEHDIMCWGDMLGDGKSFNPKNPETLDNIGDYFYNIINQSGDARTRVHKNHGKASANADHDDGAMFFAEWTEEETRSHLMTKSDSDAKSSREFWQQFLAGFQPFVKYTKRHIQDGDVKYGRENAGWKKMRERLLLETGERLRVALVATQALQGNYVPGDRTASVVFGRKDWDSAEGDRTLVNSFAEKLFTKQGVNNEFSSVLNFMGSEVGNNYDERSKKSDWKRNNAKTKKMLDPGESGFIFKNSSQIWEVMQNFG